MTLTRLGQLVEGCMFVGLNRIGQQAYAILVAPSSTETELQQKTSNSSTSGTQSVIDGFANTHAMNNCEHPAAQYCASLTVNGQGDFYLPSKNELKLCYRALKLTCCKNFTYGTARNLGNLSTPGSSNRSSIPIGAPYTVHLLRKSIIVNTRFNFATAHYYTSTETSKFTNRGIFQDFSNGYEGWIIKISVKRVRAVRRQLIVEI